MSSSNQSKENGVGGEWKRVELEVDGKRVTFERFDREVLKSPNDNDRQYRLIRLPNQLEALLISDPTTDKAACSLNLGIGHLSDPADLPGLAHFCEHLLFLGTERFPDEAEYKAYLSANAGSSNASTSLDETNFFFDCTPAGFAGALSRHSQFFVKPLFDKDCTTRELNAVDSEFRRNLALDSRRLFQLGKHISNREEGSVYWKFGTGSKDTLGNVDVRERLLEWYGQHYSANLMKLSMISTDSLDELERLTLLEYSAIPNQNLPAPLFSVSPLTTNELDKLISYRTIKDSPQLRIEFPFPDSRHSFAQKPSNYISHLVGDESAGSILSLLKKRNLATSLSASSNSGAAGFDFFRISISLTHEGLAQQSTVLQIVFAYLDILRSQSAEEWVFNETQSLGQIAWRFKEKSQPSPTVRSICSALHNPVPRERLLISPYFATEFHPELIRTCIAGLTKERCRVFIGSNVPLDERGWNEVEEYYGTEYRIDALELDGKDYSEFLSLPKPNLFIPKDLELVNGGRRAGVEVTKRPLLVKQSNSTTVWWKGDDQWFVPRATAYFLLRTSIVDRSASNAVKSQLFTQLVEEALTESTYSASLAGLNYSFGNDPEGLQIVVSGYNDKLQVLLEVIIGAITGFEMDADRFELLKGRLRRAYGNTKLSNPSAIADGHFKDLMRETYWTFEERLVALEAIQPADIVAFVNPLLADLSLRALVHGNVSKETALSLSRTVELAFSVKSADPISNDYHRSLLLPLHTNTIYRPPVPSSENVNSSASIFYSLDECSGNYSLIAKLQLFAQIASQPIFSELRTKQQLGYIVQSGAATNNGTVGFRVIVQSEREGEVLEGRIEEMWLGSFAKYLEEMTVEAFERQRSSIIAKRLEKPKNLSQETGRYFAEISSPGELDFYFRERDAVEFAKLGKEDIVDFFEESIKPSSETRTKLSILMRSQRYQPSALGRLGEVLEGEEMRKLIQGKPTVAQLRSFIAGADSPEKRLELEGVLEELIALPSLKEGIIEVMGSATEFRKGRTRAQAPLVVGDYTSDLEAVLHL